MDEAIRAKLEKEIQTETVVLFMKGNPMAPRCGFSATVVGILDELVGKYHTVDVLADPEIRDGIKTFSDWPTIPQLYIKGEFVGGCDLVKEMFESGELEENLGLDPSSLPMPTLRVSEQACTALKSALDEASAETGGAELGVRIGIGSDFQHELSLAEPQPRDVTVEASGLSFLFDRASARRAEGLAIDYVQGEGGPAFKLENPNEPPRVQSISVSGLAEALKDSDKLELFDVRTQHERETAQIAGSRLLDREAQDYLLSLDKSTPLYFHCHHGQRSQQAAAFFLSQGFESVFNVEGGIDAWSREVDSSVPTY